MRTPLPPASLPLPLWVMESRGARPLVVTFFLFESLRPTLVWQGQPVVPLCGCMLSCPSTSVAWADARGASGLAIPGRSLGPPSLRGSSASSSPGNNPMIPGENIEDVVEHVVLVHESVGEFSKQFLQKLRRSNYVTPKNYLDFINMYSKLLDEKTQFNIGEAGDAAADVTLSGVAIQVSSSRVPWGPCGRDWDTRDTVWQVNASPPELQVDEPRGRRR